MIFPCAYLGPISYYSALLQAERVEIEGWESFPKRTYRNRCQIAGVNGVQMLTIPVGKCDSKQLTKDVKITYQLPWQQQHWMALKSAYEHTPYYIYYEDYLRSFYEKKWDFLIDYDMELQQTVLELMQVDCPVRKGGAIITKEWQGCRLEDYWKEPDENNRKRYYQIFADKCGFQENLSIIDLLFNMGPESQQILSML